MMLTIFGSVVLDTIRTPKKTLKETLGGAATYAAVSASRFVNTGLVAVIGTDFPEKYYDTLCKHAMLDGVVTRQGKTFRYDAEYDSTLGKRTTLKTEVNVLEGFDPMIPDAYHASRYLYLANSDPDQNLALLRRFNDKKRSGGSGSRTKFTMCDTIDFWINTKRSSVIEVMRKVDAAIMNDEEAVLLASGYKEKNNSGAEESNLSVCAKKIQKETGVPYLIIKKGQHGSLLFAKGKKSVIAVAAAPAYTLENVTDPTGAGDAFGGAMIGYLASLDKAKISTDDLRRATTYGNIMGSFAVEGYGLDGLLQKGRRKTDINERVRKYVAALPK